MNELRLTIRDLMMGHMVLSERELATFHRLYHECAMAEEEDLGDNDRQHDDDYNQRPNRARAV